MCTQCTTTMLAYQCVHVRSTTPLTCTLFTSPSTASQVLPPNLPTSATTAPVQRPTLGASNNTALTTTDTAMNITPTDHTASAIRAGAGAGTEAMIEAPSAEVCTDPTKTTTRRVQMQNQSPLICQTTPTVSKQTFNMFFGHTNK
jgi:hypothetical protein